MDRLRGTAQETAMLGAGRHGRQENLLPLAPSLEEGGEEEVLKSCRGFWESYTPRR